MRGLRITLMLLATCIFLSLPASALTYADLVGRLVDLEGLAILPVPGETCKLWSSYNRASKYDADEDKYWFWSVNNDGTGYIRRETAGYVLAEMKGPGCIWRIWSADPSYGRVKIYLDGNSKPAVDLPFTGYFDRKNAPFTYGSLVHVTARGSNCYVPIPYQKSCKVVAESGWGAYYQFTYSTFPKDTVVPTFTRNLSTSDKDALADVDEFLSSKMGDDPAGSRSGQMVYNKSLILKPKSKSTVAIINGKRAITCLKVSVDMDDVPEPYKRLREVLLNMGWDGETTPSVSVPLGDFFGTAPGTAVYRSLPVGMTSDSDFYSYWYMPFASSGTIQLRNDGIYPLPITVSIVHAPVDAPIEYLGRFHAKWHRDAFANNDDGRGIDWTILKAYGTGRFCGTMLHVWNPGGKWWGEGDEKFFVDGEKFPSSFGTGSEDYFGYAHCSPVLFQNAFHNQTRSENNKGNISVNRWQIADNVPFMTSFEGCIEKFLPNSTPCLYAATAYFYLQAGQPDPYPMPLVSYRVGYFGAPK